MHNSHHGLVPNLEREKHPVRCPRWFVSSAVRSAVEEVVVRARRVAGATCLRSAVYCSHTHPFHHAAPDAGLRTRHQPRGGGEEKARESRTSRLAPRRRSARSG